MDNEKWIIFNHPTLIGEGDTREVVNNLKIRRNDTDNTPIAIVACPYGWDNSLKSEYKKETIQRANLIASAPEMLDALKLSLRAIVLGKDEDEICAIIESVIKKAEKDTL